MIEAGPVELRYVAYQVDQADQSNSWSPSPVCVKRYYPKKLFLMF